MKCYGVCMVKDEGVSDAGVAGGADGDDGKAAAGADAVIDPKELAEREAAAEEERQRREWRKNTAKSRARKRMKAAEELNAAVEADKDGDDLPDDFEGLPSPKQLIQAAGGKKWMIRQVQAIQPGSKDALAIIKMYYDDEARRMLSRRMGEMSGSEKRIEELMGTLLAGTDGKDGGE